MGMAGLPNLPLLLPTRLLAGHSRPSNSKSDGRALPLLAERRRLTNKLVTFLVLPRALCSPVSLAVSALIIQPASLPQAHSFHHQTPMLEWQKPSELVANLRCPANKGIVDTMGHRNNVPYSPEARTTFALPIPWPSELPQAQSSVQSGDGELG